MLGSAPGIRQCNLIFVGIRVKRCSRQASFLLSASLCLSPRLESPSAPLHQNTSPPATPLVSSPFYKYPPPYHHPTKLICPSPLLHSSLPPPFSPQTSPPHPS